MTSTRVKSVAEKYPVALKPQIALGRAIPGHHFVGLFNPDKMPRVIFVFSPGLARVVTQGVQL